MDNRTQETRSVTVSTKLTPTESTAYSAVAAVRGCTVSDLLRGPETPAQIVEAFERIRAVADKPAA